MEYISGESQEGKYDVYQDASGKKFFVLEGLSIDDQVVSPPLQQFIHAQYGLLSTMYWLMLIATLTYLAGMYIVMPLLRRHGLYW